MPAPDTKVLNYILNLYIVYDKQLEEDDKEAQKPVFSMANLMSIAGTAKDYLTGNNKINKILGDICDQIKYSINCPNKTPEDWVKIIFELGDKAAIAQSVKPTAGQSRCCEILHAIRNEVLRSMLKEDDEYKKAIVDKIAELKEKISVNDEKGDESILEKQGVGVEDLDKEVMLAYRQLAYLEDKVSIRRAKRYGLIDHLYMINEREEQFRTEKIREYSVCHFTGNKALPYLLQAETFETLYADKYQKQTNYSVADFRLKGIPSKDKKLPESKKTQAKTSALSPKDDKKNDNGSDHDKEHADTKGFEDLGTAPPNHENQAKQKPQNTGTKSPFGIFSLKSSNTLISTEEAQKISNGQSNKR